MLRRKRRVSGALVIMAFLAVVFSVEAMAPTPASATHGRALQLSWERTSTDSVEFSYTASFRASYFGSPTVGSTVNVGVLDFGDSTNASLDLEVVQVDTVNDWFIGHAVVPHTYTTPGPFLAQYSGCCRLSAPLHINNPDGSYIVQTKVDLSLTGSPESSIAPIVDCPPNAPCAFSIPATDPAGGSLSYRLADPAESGITTQPAGATVDPTSGLFSWNTTGATVNTPPSDTYYSTQVVIEHKDGAGAVQSSVAVDFFIRIATGSSNQAPVFEAPTPADGSTINGTVGSPITFDVKASDPDAGDTVTPGTIGLPAGATFTPTPGNPATATFSWTPSAPGPVVLNLTAQDQNGLGALVRSVTLDVTAGTTNSAPVAVDDSATTTENTAVSGNVLTNDTDADPGDTLSAVKVTDPANGTVVLGTDGAFTYTPNSGFTGTDSFTYKANDGDADSNTATVIITVYPGGGGEPPCTITGSNGADTLVGTPGDDVICGLGGNDSIRGLGGNDIIRGGDGHDCISGGDGDDAIDAGKGNDYVSGGDGDDTIVGGAGNDDLSGQKGNDALDGGNGHDELFGGSGMDTLDGGAHGDYLNGGADDDVLSGGSGSDDLAGGSGNDAIDAGSGNDEVHGAQGDDTIEGGDGHDYIRGGSGNDTINAGAGNDEVHGDAGDDVINGGPGNDCLYGGPGADIIDGGPGKDKIVGGGA